MILHARAPAKINLGLEILGRRADGFHEVRTILQTVALADDLTFADAADLSLDCAPSLGPTERNLVLRAARLLQARTGVSRGATISLRKSIPVAAGLGGGSSDAAATLRGLSRLWGLDLSDDDLADLAGALGSDVPFFLRGGAQLATGRGEHLEPLPSARLWVVLVTITADVPDKTRGLYAAIRPEDWTSGSRVTSLAARLRLGGRLDGEELVSGFKRATSELFPEVGRAFDLVARAGGTPSLCGAGPSVLSLHPREAEARAVAGAAGRLGLNARVTTTSDQPIMIWEGQAPSRANR